MSSRFAEIAVPIPLHHPLTYAVPDAFGELTPGCRVRVRVGPRKLVGVVLGLTDEEPEDFTAKPIDEILDVEPSLIPELLELANFIADYYLTPIGEAVSAMLPSALPPWGHRRVSLTNAGAIAPPRDPVEAAVVETLLEHRRMRLVDLQKELGTPGLAGRLEELQRLGRITMDDPGRRGGRFIKAVELREGDLAQQLEQVGRSPKGRAVVEYLAALKRPATVRELTNAVECGTSVVKRLVGLNLLREFTQAERQSLARHRLQTSGPERKIVLRPDQQHAVDQLLGALESRSYAPFLLAGMTGSGKTEVYLRAVDRCLAQQRTAILLVPEIALVPALARVTRQRYGRLLAILHSNLSSAERLQEWERLRRGEARVVLGPRSALLAPVTDLGLVVVDEEHDTSYKQDSNPRYNGRDLALLRARNHGAVAVLASATPSLESRHNVTQKKLTSLLLTARAGQGELPEGILVDLRDEKTGKRPGEIAYSSILQEEIERALKAGDQVILLRNRRGYAPILLCRACGEDFKCDDCGLPLTYHKRRGRLICHYCDDARPRPSVCPACKEEALEPIGAGTERVEEDFQKLFPDVTVDVLDADSRRQAGGAAAVLERFSSGQTQVLIGTQMVAKGHHFPRVSLAAVLLADSYLGFPDFRAVERTYALLTQLAGRAGRGDRPGRVVIQTYHPHHYAVRAALEHNDKAFITEEMRFRRAFHYPPFSRMVQLLGRHQDGRRVELAMKNIAEQLLAHPLAAKMRITGPAPAPLERLRGQWRHQILIRGSSGPRLRRLVQEVVEGQKKGEIDLTVDVDPYDLM